MTALDLITLEEAKTFLGVDFPDHDALITDLIKSAVETVENKTNHRLYERDITITTYKDLTIYDEPLNSIVSVTDEDGTVDYETHYNYNTELFFDECTKLKTVVVNVGYMAGACPVSLKLACKAIIDYRYNNRQAMDIPAAVEAELANYRKSTWF